MYLLFPTTWRFIIICSHCFSLAFLSLSIYLDTEYYGKFCRAISVANLTNRSLERFNKITKIPAAQMLKIFVINCEFETIEQFQDLLLPETVVEMRHPILSFLPLKLDAKLYLRIMLVF